MNIWARCPLCGSTVPLKEVARLGYCKVCLLLVEALTGQQSKSGNKSRRLRRIKCEETKNI
ncbi:MAG: hypothetical protein DDT33_01667 [Firmicutes bacterium]|nr:hypothetical protein [Bacillota bacterium]